MELITPNYGKVLVVGEEKWTTYLNILCQMGNKIIIRIGKLIRVRIRIICDIYRKKWVDWNKFVSYIKCCL